MLFRSAASSSVGSVPSSHLAQFANIIDAALSAKRQLAEIENIEANTAQTETNTAWIDALNSGKIEQMKAASENLLADSNLKQSQIDVNIKSIEKMAADIAVEYDSLETARAQRAKIQQEIDVLVDGLLTSAKQRGVYDKQMGKLAAETKILLEELEIVSDKTYQSERKFSIKVDNDNKEAQTNLAKAQETLSYLQKRGEERYGLGSEDPFMVGLNYFGSILGTIGKVFGFTVGVSKK